MKSITGRVPGLHDNSETHTLDPDHLVTYQHQYGIETVSLQMQIKQILRDFFLLTNDVE